MRPAAVAPFEVAVVVAQVDDPLVAETGERIYRQLVAERVDVVIDDRAERAGVKRQVLGGLHQHPTGMGASLLGDLAVIT
ncbi:MAG: hypothetical protein ACK4MT_07760, partial [Thermaurantiacus tibetensis]